jgi:hypothetical protein
VPYEAENTASHCLSSITSLNEGCFKKSFTTLKAYIISFRGHVQCF